MSDCLFCKIAAGEIPSNKVYEDESVLAFRDIQSPGADSHPCDTKAHVADSAAQITEGPTAPQ